jgi:gliding motility-associated-like protein
MKHYLIFIFLVCIGLTARSQSFLNGSFENSATTTNIINTTNANYTSVMNNSSAFGTFGNMDIITSCTWGCPTYGSWYVSLTGNGTDAISMELSQSLVSGNTYSFTFYDRKHQSYQCTPIQIGLSTSATAFGTLVWTASATATNSTWVQRTVTFVAPNNGSYITVKQSGGTTGFWAHIDNFEFSSYAPSVDAEYLCYGDFTQFSIDSTGFDSVYWNFGDTNSGTSNYSNLESPNHQFSDTGTYSIQLVTHLDSNSDTSFHTVYIYPRQWADLGNDTALCVGSELFLSVDQPFAEYEWSTGSAVSAITVTSDSVVMVTVFGICDTISDTLNIDWLLPFVIDLGGDTNLCTYDMDNIDPGLSNSLSYTWNTGSSQPTQLVNDTGMFAVTVTNGVCTYSDSVFYGYYPEVSVSLGNDSSFCYTPSAELVPIVQNVSSYLWSNGSVGNTLNVGVSSDYLVTAYGVGGFCQAEDVVHWDFWFEPLVDLGNDTSFCHNDVLKLDPWTQSAFPIEYRWNDNSNDSVLNLNLIGLYWVEVSDENCSMKDTILIDQYPILEVDLGEDRSACIGDEVELKPLGSQALTNYSWSDGSSNSTLKVSEHGTYSISVNNDLCEATDKINVFIFDYPFVDLGPDTSICPKDEIELDATVPIEIVSYKWDDGSSAPVRMVQGIGVNQIWIKATNGVCSTYDTININNRSVASLNLMEDTAICEGDELIIRANSSYDSVSWNGESQSNVYIVSDSGGYSANAFDGYCFTNDSFHVAYKPEPSDKFIQFETPTEICIGEQFFVDKYQELITAYSWQDGSTTSTFLIENEGEYWVQGYHQCGVVSDTIIIENCECPIWLPNSFNPSGNGQNDFFSAKAECEFGKFEFKVFNRWGELMFESTDPNAFWDGMYRGETAAAGSYAWTLEYSASHERNIKKERLSGQVLLLR